MNTVTLFSDGAVAYSKISKLVTLVFDTADVASHAHFTGSGSAVASLFHNGRLTIHSYW